VATKELDREAYLRMLKIRHFEQAVSALITEGEVAGACHSSIGQEGGAVGSVLSLTSAAVVNGASTAAIICGCRRVCSCRPIFKFASRIDEARAGGSASCRWCW